MAIFGRSKKNQTTTPPSHSQSTTSCSQPPNPYLINSQPNWAYVQQQSNASHVNQPSSQGWLIAPIPPQYQPVFVQQNYPPPPPPPLPQRPQQSGAVSRYQLGSVTNLLAGHGPGYSTTQLVQGGVGPLYPHDTQHVDQEAALCDLISSKFDTLITLIDGGRFNGDEQELMIEAEDAQQRSEPVTERGFNKAKSKSPITVTTCPVTTKINYFSKVHLYANSRLPPNLPPLKLYVTTYPLLCLAAQYAQCVYDKPSGQEKESHVDADWRHGTKAMVIKSVPMDDMNTIVFAIRGSQFNFKDWAVNLRTAPVSPEGFLDDAGNFCHKGFLSVAKKMVKPVAARLRQLLEDDPRRSKCSLLITGHSAGGAVAALLYAHMLATNPETESELNILTGCFKRVHCVTFGAPPVSLLPLAKPTTPSLRKSIFLSFVNEGDPVVRAEPAYMLSLLELYSKPAPGKSCLNAATPQKLQPLVSGLGKSTSSLNVNKIRPSKPSKNVPSPGFEPVWPVPEATLCNAGRLVLLRSVDSNETQPKKKKQIQDRMNEGVIAQIVTDELLRGFIWGDPMVHGLAFYARRIEILATNAVMGR